MDCPIETLINQLKYVPDYATVFFLYAGEKSCLSHLVDVWVLSCLLIHTRQLRYYIWLEIYYKHNVTPIYIHF